MWTAKTTTLLLTLLPALAACDGATPSTPSAPSPGPPPAPPAAQTLAVFKDMITGFSTSDLRDAQDQIVQLTAANELVWTADGTRLTGYRASTWNWVGRTYYFIEGKICAEGCSFEVRFGAADGERRAYLTVDYGHDNPGTLVDVELAGGELRVAQTSAYPPGTPTLSGLVTGATTNGPVPLVGVNVYRGISTGWRATTTDRNGYYEIRGLQDGNGDVSVSSSGYQKAASNVVMSGDTRFDVELAATPD